MIDLLELLNRRQGFGGEGRFALESVRLEKTLLKVLKGLAEYCEITLGDLLEGIVLHAFEGKAPFSPETLAAIQELKKVYHCPLTAADRHSNFVLFTVHPP